MPPVIRGVKASASLKRDQGIRQRRVYADIYPRCKSLGLIEAIPALGRRGRVGLIRGVKASASLKLHHRPPRARYRQLIRGVKASASLKQKPSPGRRRAQGSYPRCKSLGLIEAQAQAGEAARSWRIIRGVKASASLKPRRTIVAVFGDRDFIRGVKASASLKRRPLGIACVCGAGYPRCKSLGLIEAKRRSSKPLTGAFIRGVKASASLKRESSQFGRQRLLIIRGVKASASLKPIHARSDCAPGHVIRGVKASASLKHPSRIA